MTRKLKIFLCHASEDKPAIRELYKRLVAETWIDPWLDEENLLPGQDWNLEINKATREADVILICMSKASVEKEGYLNKEIRRVLDISNEKLEGAIYIIPLRLDDCNPSFERLKQIHYADYFTPNAHGRLLKSLRMRADSLKIETSESKSESVVEPKPNVSVDVDFDNDLYRFIEIQPQTNSKIPYAFWIGKYPVTNAQYQRFLNAADFANPIYWLEIPMFDSDSNRTGDWQKHCWDWLQKQMKGRKTKILFPNFWDSKDFGIASPHNPVVGVSWYEASAYCEWLFQNWNVLIEGEVNDSFQPQSSRLPLDNEWITAAGGDEPQFRYPWDRTRTVTSSLKEVLRRANFTGSNVGHTTPVTAYPLGKSPYGVMDLAGNVWEWQANSETDMYGISMNTRGGAWDGKPESRSASMDPDFRNNTIGFRAIVLPSV